MKIWSSGWNVPGFLPEVEPINTPDHEGARTAIVEALEQAADDWEEDDATAASEYRDAAGTFSSLPAGQSYSCRIRNYLWWLELVDLPESELTESVQ